MYRLSLGNDQDESQYWMRYLHNDILSHHFRGESSLAMFNCSLPQKPLIIASYAYVLLYYCNYMLYLFSIT